MERVVLDMRGKILKMLKGVVVGVCITVVGIVVLALVSKFVGISDSVIRIINQIIKIVSVFFAVKVANKNLLKGGLVSSAVVGLLYAGLTYLLFSLLVANFTFGMSFVYDLIFEGLIGLICGVMVLSARK